MPIEKLEEFARDGQKNTDELILTDGFPRPKFPARQWFNYLFNMLSLKINELIELDPISKAEIIDNLTTNDADKVASARTVKELQDNKLDITDGTATRLSASQLNLGDSKIEVVTGSNYTITYNYSNRIAHIRMKILSNQSVSSNSVFVNQQSNSATHFKALITLPITLQSRLSQSFELVSTNSGVPYSNEAAEWLRFFDPINTNNSSESKVGINLIRWVGSTNEAIDAYLEVTGVF